jgi:hypothetical protein
VIQAQRTELLHRKRGHEESVEIAVGIPHRYRATRQSGSMRGFTKKRL